MAKYNDFKYGSGKTYGEIAANKYSAEPMEAYCQDYSQVLLTWETPQPNSENPIVKFRIVRNQYAYSETPVDGVILYDEIVGPGNSWLDTFEIASGRFAFYTIWLQLTVDSAWVIAGTAEVLVPNLHTSRIYPRYTTEDNISVGANILLQTTHERFLSYIPRVFTSEAAITDDASQSNDLSLFLEGFSFTVDEFLTYTQLVLPGLTGRYTNAAILKLQGNQLGVPEDTQGLTKTQKFLVRDAIYIYSRKGTLSGLTRFVKSITNYVPSVYISRNIMLSLQTSTFYKGIGNWKGSTGIVFTALNTGDVPTPPPGDTDLVIDNSWIAKIDATTTPGSSFPSVYLGDDSPVSQGIPVTAGVEYVLSYYVKRNNVTGSIYGQSINWYDQHGKRILDSAPQVGQTVTTSWLRQFYTRTAPAGAVFATIGLTFTTGAIYYLDRVHFCENVAVDFYEEARAVTVYLNSNSLFADTKYTKIPRLNAEIKKYLPLNTPYFVTSINGVESFGISS